MGKNRLFHYSGIGGQAVLEGVMMRNKDLYSVSVRKPSGEIFTSVEEYHGLLSGSPLLRIPFVRGIFVFIDSLVLGLKVTNYSASFYDDDEKDRPLDKVADAVAGDKSEKLWSALTTVIAFAVAIGLFLVLPVKITGWMGSYLHSQALKAAFEGAVRISIFVLYILVISLMSDIRRLFAYHGAEHKCINCIESGLPLTVANVKKSSRFHRRCGSSFILLVLLISVILFMFIRTDSIVLKLIYRLLLLPVISGISYEIIRLAGRSDNILVKIISAPGMLLQRLTVKEPDDSMIEVGIASVEAVFDWRFYQKDAFGYDLEDDEDESEAYDED
ncbi:DUF1385 domain-containing protein [Butyrivibrio sp. MC2013]|uniref:DUF1385 domain-containing protein n=1 Tax=Butyrivibrio sp. MC2013 TaxID=1280686 RepID=UPI000417FB20|nr:DUF1385 domain-containing protein [Butyrivibrio sp. MC2013]